MISSAGVDPTSWSLDVQTITTKQLTTTGGTLWSAATRCREFLCKSGAAVGLDRPGVRVLELGAGCGTLGLTLARNLPHAAEVCLTEQAYGGALDHLRLNVAANVQLPHMGSVTCCACDWTHFTDPAVLQAAAVAAAAGAEQQQQTRAAAAAEAATGAADGQVLEQGGMSSSSSTGGVSTAELLDLHKLLSTQWDIIVGSDLVYNTAGARALPRVLATLMPASPQQQLQQQQQQHGVVQQQHQGPGICSCQHSTQQEPQHDRPQTDGTCSGCQCSCGASVGPVMYYAHTKHRYDAMDVLLFERLAAEGLTVEEVVEPGCELPPPSPPPFSSLFPDMRCAVFKIQRAV